MFSFQSLYQVQEYNDSDIQEIHWLTVKLNKVLSS